MPYGCCNASWRITQFKVLITIYNKVILVFIPCIYRQIVIRDLMMFLTMTMKQAETKIERQTKTVQSNREQKQTPRHRHADTEIIESEAPREKHKDKKHSTDRDREFTYTFFFPSFSFVLSLCVCKDMYDYKPHVQIYKTSIHMPIPINKHPNLRQRFGSKTTTPVVWKPISRPGLENSVCHLHVNPAADSETNTNHVLPRTNNLHLAQRSKVPQACQPFRKVAVMNIVGVRIKENVDS